MCEPPAPTFSGGSAFFPPEFGDRPTDEDCTCAEHARAMRATNVAVIVAAMIGAASNERVRSFLTARRHARHQVADGMRARNFPQRDHDIAAM